MGCVSKPRWTSERERGHNIPHYANVSRVGEASYLSQPFSEPQTVFHMPPDETIQKRLDQFKKEQGIVDAQNPYDKSAEIFDGLSKAEEYERIHGPANKTGRWASRSADQSRNAIPGKGRLVSAGSIPAGTPIRLSISAKNKFGGGGGEQVELRVDFDEIDDIFMEWTKRPNITISLFSLCGNC